MTFVRALTGAEYPARLRELGRQPEVLFVAGELPCGPSVAIVGTRSPTDQGRAFSFKLAAELAERGVVVMSGGASGIDTAAHEGALAAGGKTVVVAPSSFDRPYPEENAGLFRRVVESGGAFVTTQTEGTPARRHQFFARNAELVAFTDALVVVETGIRGGARNAAKAARDLGRPILVVPGAPWTPEAKGCLQEIQWGARMVISSKDVLRRAFPDIFSVDEPAGQPALPFGARPLGRKISPGVAELPEYPSDSDESRVLAALRNGALGPDDICAETSLTPARVQATLLTLTLEGIVVSEPSGRSSLVRF